MSTASSGCIGVAVASTKGENGGLSGVSKGGEGVSGGLIEKQAESRVETELALALQGRHFHWER